MPPELFIDPYINTYLGISFNRRRCGRISYIKPVPISRTEKDKQEWSWEGIFDYNLIFPVLLSQYHYTYNIAGRSGRLKLLYNKYILYIVGLGPIYLHPE